MQKISSYLYPNRINVVADLAAFPVRWNIVYQNRVKIYKGVDNIITIDFKNADQKRIDIIGQTIDLSVMDVNGQLVGSFPVIPSTNIGLATVNIDNESLSSLDPQFLKFSLIRSNVDATKTVFYADTQFGALGSMELVGTATSIVVPQRSITTWIEINNTLTLPWTKTFYSDAVEIKKPNYLDVIDNDSIEFEFLFSNLDANLIVQFTKDTVVGAGSIWKDIETFAVTPTTSTLIKTYSYANTTYNREYSWARVNYVRTTNNTGKIDKVLINL